jgi:hypothetical protein
LCWGKPKIKRKWIISEFFEQQFDEFATLRFRYNQQVNYIRIEKKGYYWGEIELPKRLHKDYNIEVVLRPKPMIKSSSYISNAKIKVARLSEYEIQLYDGRTFKKEKER